MDMGTTQIPPHHREVFTPEDDVKNFRKIPVEVFAEQWFPGKKVPGVHCRHRVIPRLDEFDEPWEEYYCVDTLEGELRVSPGDWIITGVKGEQYPCKPDIFNLTYEPLVVDNSSQ